MQDKWFKQVRTRVVSAGDQLYVRLEDQDTGAPGNSTKEVRGVGCEWCFMCLGKGEREGPLSSALVGTNQGQEWRADEWPCIFNRPTSNTSTAPASLAYSGTSIF